jgi:outer membrane protein assembly factor BamA
MTKKMLTGKAVLLACITLPTVALAQDLSGTQPFIETKGSIPPVSEWYSCVRDMRGKPFDRKEVDGCLHSVLSHPHLTAGKVVVKPRRGFTNVTFVLESPALTLSKVDFGLPVDRQIEFENLMRQDEFAPHAGDIYDYRKADQAETKLEQFLKSKGVLTLVSKDVALDYDHKTASLVYRVWEGPSINPEEPLLPGPRRCDVYVRNFNEINIDDYTPLPLIDSILGIRRTPCFSSDAIKKAKQQLDSTDLFSSIEVKTSDSGEWRDVSVSARTKPTIVKHILYKWYGALSNAHTVELPPLPLAENQVYKRSSALGTRDLLSDFFRKSGLNVKVSEEDSLEPDHQLSVVFHVLGAKTDSLSIDGEPVQQGASVAQNR